MASKLEPGGAGAKWHSAPFHPSANEKIDTSAAAGIKEESTIGDTQGSLYFVSFSPVQDTDEQATPLLAHQRPHLLADQALALHRSLQASSYSLHPRRRGDFGWGLRIRIHQCSPTLAPLAPPIYSYRSAVVRDAMLRVGRCLVPDATSPLFHLASHLLRNQRSVVAIFTV